MNTFSEKLSIFIQLNKYDLLRKTVGYIKYYIQYAGIIKQKKQGCISSWDKALAAMKF